ncbi:MAG: hypothetical protein A2Y74_00540 [Actinobacteria bacterium RBG_13_63_9]|nr:MAG: hypothetical protein A2Y74_00540 [Actinobacteria bacterium RBG_13_63_9]
MSVVVPVFNEEAVLSELRHRLTATLEKTSARFEVIFVDDGSFDSTPALSDRICDEDPRFKCVHLSRNFGHQAAVSAGLRYAGGDVICLMDADLQDPPEILPRLLAQWEKGADAVYAVRRDRKEHWFIVVLYHFFYRILSHLSSVSIPLDAGDFCLLSREVVDAINRLPEKERFVRGLRAWVGYNQVAVEYARDARHGGQSKYSLLGLTRLAITGIVSFSDRPLLYVTIAGLVISGAALIYGAFLVVLAIAFKHLVTGYASLMSAVLFLGGIQLVAIGLVGIYVGRIFREVKGRPTYVVRSLHGLEEQS